MRLIVEDSDRTKIGIPPGEYDLNDLGALRGVNVKGGLPGAYHDIEIVLCLNAGMKPEPGSVGEPHFKFGVDVEDALQYRNQIVTIFGRPDGIPGASAVAYNARVDDCDLRAVQDPRAHAKKIVDQGVRVVAEEIAQVLVEQAIEQVLGKAPPGIAPAPTRSDDQKRQDAFFGLLTPKSTCDECGGSGRWKNPANGHESACLKGCPVP